MISENPKIRCEALWKIFGPNPKTVIESWEERYSSFNKTELLDTTGCLVAVKDANITIHEGEVFVLMGLSGSGKSTLLRLINLLHVPTKGRIFIEDQELTTLSNPDLREVRRQKTGMVFQHFGLLPHRRVIDNVAYGLEIQGKSKSSRVSKSMEVLELVGLKGWGDAYPHELSGGMQQRVGLARALATDPEILLMDEAFSALDPMIRRQMQDEFIKLLRVVRKTVVFVTHDLHEALRLADRIAVMNAGAIIQVGTSEEIVLHPRTEYVAEFVRDLPKIKFVTAASIMMKPDKWLVSPTDTTDTIIKKMEKENLWYAFLLTGDGRVQGALHYHSLIEKHGGRSGALNKSDIFSEYPIASKQTFLEELVRIAARTPIPIVITDPGGCVVGVVPRGILLTAISGAEARHDGEEAL